MRGARNGRTGPRVGRMNTTFGGRWERAIVERSGSMVQATKPDAERCSVVGRQPIAKPLARRRLRGDALEPDDSMW